MSYLLPPSFNKLQTTDGPIEIAKYNRGLPDTSLFTDDAPFLYSLVKSGWIDIAQELQTIPTGGGSKRWTFSNGNSIELVNYMNVGQFGIKAYIGETLFFDIGAGYSPQYDISPIVTFLRLTEFYSWYM